MFRRNLFSICIVAIGVLWVSCSEDDPAVPETGAYSGTFVSAIHPTSGTALVNEEKTTLFLSNFKTDAGPDLNIYLASDIGNVTSDFIDLGDIKGVNGNYAYDLPENVDFTQYQYVVVWCVAFAVNFGYAELKE